MVDIVLLQTVSIAIASAGVFVAAIYYILQIRHQTKLRQTDVIIRLCSFASSKEFLDAWETLRGREIKSVDNYMKKYGSLTEVNQVIGVSEELGMLLKRRLIDLDLIDDLMGRHAVIVTFEKMEPFNEKFRKELREGEMTSFEYLYNEIKKMEQAPKQT